MGILGGKAIEMIGSFLNRKKFDVGVYKIGVYEVGMKSREVVLGDRIFWAKLEFELVDHGHKGTT